MESDNPSLVLKESKKSDKDEDTGKLLGRNIQKVLLIVPLRKNYVWLESKAVR